MPRGGRPGSVDGTDISPESVDTGSLSLTNSDTIPMSGSTVAIGEGVSSSFRSVIIGRNVDDQGNDVIIGEGASTSGSGQNVVVGRKASAVGNGIAIGPFVVVNTDGLARIGGNQLVFRGVRDTVANADLKNGELTIELDETNSAFRLRGKDSGGTVREATIPW